MTYEIQQKSRKEVQLAREIRFSGNVNDEGNGRRLASLVGPLGCEICTIYNNYMVDITTDKSNFNKPFKENANENPATTVVLPNEEEEEEEEEGRGSRRIQGDKDYKIPVYIPEFKRTREMEEFFTWVDEVTSGFEVIDCSEDRKIKVVTNKLKGSALAYWKYLKNQRALNGSE
ncbi:hypothetical protein LWI28_005451 [Acer negundo]|uniref:Uncharacterized protein n=1 Tax=Acer negundo TaxID=4023 RepID=A0AAD5IKR4_ACENE|nr:hypothetical protein LWI28_005451 [Acer negundo]